MEPKTSTEIAIEAYEIAEANLLLSLMSLKSDEIYKQIGPEFNSIGWIFGHCAVHLHWVIDLTYQKKRTYNEEVCHYFRYGTTKEEINQTTPPIKFKDLVDAYLEISKSSLEFLHQKGDDSIHDEFPQQPKETLLHQIYRIIFHYMGHMGQIVMIRRALGNPGRSFVDGVRAEYRDALLKDWHKWWNDSKHEFVE
jgi:hypothetical protein